MAVKEYEGKKGEQPRRQSVRNINGKWQRGDSYRIRCCKQGASAWQMGVGWTKDFLTLPIAPRWLRSHLKSFPQ